jgi:hypothetical protein
MLLALAVGTVGWVSGMLLDFVLGIKSPPTYWILGFATGALVMAALL